MNKKTKKMIGMIGGIVCMIGFVTWTLGILTGNAFGDSGLSPFMIVAFFMFAGGGLTAAICLARRFYIGSKGFYIPVEVKEEEASSQKPCPSCHQSMDQNATFCSHCGTKLTASCPSCGQEVDTNAGFCKHCGTKLS